MGQCQAAVASAVFAFGRVDILLVCTSQAIIGTAEELASTHRTLSLVRDQFETNFFGPINIIRAVLPTMRAKSNGHIIILGGIAGHLGTPGLGMYCASNWALEGFCDSIAYEIAPFNLKVTIVQASIEIGILTNRITAVPPLPPYSSDTNPAPLFRGILDGLLNRLPGIKAQYPGPPPPQSPNNEMPPTPSAITTPLSATTNASSTDRPAGPSLLVQPTITTLYPPLSPTHTERLIAETIHCLVAIGGHENPPARHIVGAEGVASVKEKLKTVSEELEDFVDASQSADIDRPGSSSGGGGGQAGRESKGDAMDAGSGDGAWRLELSEAELC